MSKRWRRGVEELVDEGSQWQGGDGDGDGDGDGAMAPTDERRSTRRRPLSPQLREVAL